MMQGVRGCLFAIAALVFGGAAVPVYAQSQSLSGGMQAEAAPSLWTGDWTGWGDQGTSQWSIDIAFQSEIEATIDYATIPCAGVLRLMERSERVAVFRETLTSNAQNCIDNGIVTLTLVDNGRLQFFWKQGGTTAFGDLRRLMN